MTRNARYAPSSRRPNLLAIVLSMLCIGFLYFNTNPTTAGADPSDLATLATAANALSTPAIQAHVVRKEPIAAATGEDAGEIPDAGAEVAEAVASGPVPSLEGRMALMMNLLMLEKGREWVAGLSGYTAVFHKHERIDGSMQDAQVMRLKVRHEPFSVYMKWVKGDRGRQLLFDPNANDGKMLVKLGGLKGRLIPAVKLDPTGSKAMSESRYPVSKAGLLPMMGDMITHREEELKMPGVTCQMYDDQVVNDVECYCFIITYPSPDLSSVYRKTISYLEKDRLIPLRLCNYTWAKDSGDLSPAELDEQTLIENYAFTELDAEADLVAEDFSAKNRRYRF